MSQNNGELPPVAQEKINTDIVTLTRFLTEEQRKHKEATGDFTYVINSSPPSYPADTCLEAYYATLYNFPSSPLPTTSAVPV